MESVRTMHPQSQSPLLSLPPEIRNAIYSLVIPSSEVFTNPGLKRPTMNAPESANSQSGLALFQTCRLAHAEVDHRILYRENRFHFTQADHARRFFASLPEQHRKLVNDVELDFCEMSAKAPSIAKDWVKYLFWSDSKWTATFAGLRTDAPGLQTLRISLETWPTIATKRGDTWETLRRMLCFVRGLQRVVVSGASRGFGMAKIAPWSPVHYIGLDRVPNDDLVPIMNAAVGNSAAEGDNMLIWTRYDGKIALEMVSPAYMKTQRQWLPENADSLTLEPVLPCNGCCSMSAYTERVKWEALLAAR